MSQLLLRAGALALLASTLSPAWAQAPRPSVVIPRWTALAPLEGAGPAVRGLEASVASPNTISAWSSAGVLRSDDRGESWSRQCPWPDEVTTRPQVAVSPADPNRIVAANPVTGSMLVTRDGGASWLAPAVPPTGGYFMRLSFDPFDPDVLFAGSVDGVWKSEDGGTTFSQSLATSTEISFLKVARHNRLRVTALVSGVGVTKSEDGGATWEPQGNVPAAGTILSFAMDDRDTNRMLFGGTNLHLTEDGGQTWTAIPAPSEGFDMVAFDPMRPGRILAGLREVALMISDDLGANWTIVRGPEIDPIGANPFALLCPSSHPDLLIVGGRGGLARSTDAGVQFTRTNGGLGAFANVESVAIHPIDPDHIVAKTGGSAFVSTDGGLSWTESSSGPSFTGTDIVADPAIPGRFWAGTLGIVNGSVQLWRSNDGGFTFAPLPQSFPYYFWNLAVASNGVLFGAGSGLLRSTDGGDTFVNTGLPASWVWDVAVSPADPMVLWANSGSTVYRSTDGAMTWIPATTSPTPTVRGLHAHPTDPSICYATVPTFIDGGESLWVTMDGGDHWKSVPTGIRNGWEVHALSAYPGVVLVGQTIEAGIWYLTGNGRDARRSDRGPDSTVSGFTSSGRRVLAATSGSGVHIMR